MKNLTVAAIVVVAGVIATTISISSLEIQNHPDNNKCIGECYAEYVAANGNIVEQERAKAEAAASMSPAELGRAAYVPCQACHGAGGEGGVGPQLTGRDPSFISDALHTYKVGESRGAQSALMWGVAAPMSDTEINNLAAYIDTL